MATEAGNFEKRSPTTLEFLTTWVGFIGSCDENLQYKDSIVVHKESQNIVLHLFYGLFWIGQKDHMMHCKHFEAPLLRFRWTFFFLLDIIIIINHKWWKTNKNILLDWFTFLDVFRCLKSLQCRRPHQCVLRWGEHYAITMRYSIMICLENSVGAVVVFPLEITFNCRLINFLVRSTNHNRICSLDWI